jgi:hypothetical protein
LHNKKLKNICWALIFILFTSWSGIPRNVAYAQNTTRLKDEERKRAVEKLQKLFDALEEAAKEIPRDTFDPQVIVNKVGRDPIKLFEWVRDNTYLVPYRGSLRGPIGVLMDRMGNSLDRALLLCKLMAIAGHNVRLINGTLTKAQAETVLKKARPASPKGALPVQKGSRQTLEELIIKYPYEYGLDSAQLKRATRRMTIVNEYFAEELTQRIEEQSKAILALLGEFPDTKELEFEKAIESLKNHWWVQWERETEWVDLEPTMPDSGVGEIIAEPNDIYEIDRLDEDLYHSVTIRIFIERWEEGMFKEEKALEHRFRLSESIGKQIVLRHVPINWPPEKRRSSKDMDPLEYMNSLVLERKEWLPVLIVGSERITASSFRESGRINEKPGKKSKPDSVRGLTHGLFNVFSGKEEKKKKSMLTAERIEYEVHSPGENIHKLRRSVFDSIGPAERSQKEMIEPLLDESKRFERELILLLGESNIITSSCLFSPHFISHLITKNFLANRKILIELVLKDNLRAIAGFISSHENEISSLSIDLFLFEMARREFNISRGIYLYSPNICSLNRLPFIDRKGNRGVKLKFDIVKNDIDILPGIKKPHFLVRMEQGIFDTNIESMLMKKEDEEVENTSEIFVKSVIQGVEWVAIQGVNDPALQRVKLPMDDRTLIEQDLKKGYRVFVPERTIIHNGKELVGWWRVETNRGDTLGMMGGAGVTLKEYVIMVTKGAIPALYAWMCAEIDLNRGICHPCVIMTLTGIWFLVGFIGAMIEETATIALFEILIVEVPFLVALFSIIKGLDKLVKIAHDCLT